MSEWWIYKGTGVPHDAIQTLPDPPNWRTFKGEIIARPSSSETIDDVDIIRHIGRKTARAGVQDEQQDSELIQQNSAHQCRALFTASSPDHRQTWFGEVLTCQTRCP